MLRELLERVIEKEGGITQVAAILECSAGMVSHMRTGRYAISPEYAVKLAQCVGERGTDYIIPALVESAKTEKQKVFWTDQLGKFNALLKNGGVAAALAAGLLANGLSTSKVEAMATNQVVGSSNLSEPANLSNDESR